MPQSAAEAVVAVGANHPTDPFLHGRYAELHDGAMQAKFRRIRPWPVGCVFIEHPGMTEDDIRGHFQLMRRLGFTALKQCQTLRTTDNAKVMHLAIDQGLIPWWYGEGGWEDPTPEKLAELGIDPATPIEQLREHPAWLEQQKQVLHRRVDREAAAEAGPRLARKMADAPDRVHGANWVPSVQPDFRYELDDTQAPMFIDWLKRQYGSIEALNEAWNVHHCMIPGPVSSAGEDGPAPSWTSWEALAAEVVSVINGGFREYRRIRDVLRFKADNYCNWLRDRMDVQIAADPVAPLRAGGEMGLFLPFASRGTDMEGIAELMRERGSFYPSFHPAWHFEEVDFECTRPMYMQASLTVDWFKGGWNATWESTGGPQQMTGQKAPFVPEVREKKPGFTVDGATMTQLMLSWIAGGYRGFGIWCWTIRSAGWEGGEFALLDRNNRPTGRAVVAGKIGQACRRLRDELWTARKEPLVGVFQDWDMEAIWAATSIGGRDFFKKEPIRARIGVSRALINGNVPWEHVTGNDLRDGLADRYRVIYLPAALALDQDLLEGLHGFVQRGGRVVLDAPGGWYDEFGRVMRSDDGSPFERLFGCRLADFQYNSPQQRPWTMDGRSIPESTILDLQPTTAEVLAAFDGGRPAVTVNRIGAGDARVIAYEVSRHCTRPGDPGAEARLRAVAMEGVEPPFTCRGAIAYHLAAEGADHYFLLNDGQATGAQLVVPGGGAATDAITGEPLDLSQPVAVEAFGGRWVRVARRGA